MILRLLLLLLLSVTSQRLRAQTRFFETVLYDSVRERAVPLAVYAPDEVERCRAVVVFSHGYGRNVPGSNKAYSYLTQELARRGYFVVSIQHELPGDDSLAMHGDLYAGRLPNWERGVQTILFAVMEGRRLWPGLPWDRTVLIGHSNGGDMTMLFAKEHPQLILRALSLDHRRMPMPQLRRPRLATLRGCDYAPDPGVLPDGPTARRCGIRIVRFEDIRHGDMDDKGSPEQHARICREVLRIIR